MLNEFKQTPNQYLEVRTLVCVHQIRNFNCLSARFFVIIKETILFRQVLSINL